MQITRKTTIEEIASKSAVLVHYLSEQGIRCIRCGEPIWGTLEEAAEAKGFNGVEIDGFVRAMNKIEEER